MMVLVGITLLGRLGVEPKIIFIYVKAWHDYSGLSQDVVLFSSGPGSSGIASPGMNASPVGRTSSTWYYFLLLPGRALDSY